MWNQASLQKLVKDELSDYLFVVVSNREPYVHNYVNDKIECIVPASGLTVALDPVMRACGRTWVAHGSGSADRAVVDARNRVLVPPDTQHYTLRRVWLTESEVDKYYLGFSNETLWPLCHIVYQRPEFNVEDWNTYKYVNRLFADAVLDEIGDRKAFVFIQDYHLTLLSRMIKAKTNASSQLNSGIYHGPTGKHSGFAPGRMRFYMVCWETIFSVFTSLIIVTTSWIL